MPVFLPKKKHGIHSITAVLHELTDIRQVSRKGIIEYKPLKFKSHEYVRIFPVYGRQKKQKNTG